MGPEAGADSQGCEPTRVGSSASAPLIPGADIGGGGGNATVSVKVPGGPKNVPIVEVEMAGDANGQMQCPVSDGA